MKLDCRLTNMRYDYKEQCTEYTFKSYGNILPYLEEFQDKKLSLEVKKANKRSTTANGYAWVLLGELQEKLKIPKEELYKKYIRECGIFEVIPIRNDAIPKFTESWKQNGLGWICETGPSKLKGYTNVMAYYGTSVYTKEEMAVLLGSIVDDCIEQGIPTKRREDINSLIEEWK